MKPGDFYRAQREVKKISDDVERRKKSRWGPSEQPSSPPQIVQAPPQVIVYSDQKRGFSSKQTCLLMGLTAILVTVCLCGGLLAIPSMVSNYPTPLFQPTPVVVSRSVPLPAPGNKTREGLIFTAIRLSPYTPDYPWVDPGPGNWWRLDVSVNNASNKPLTLRGYDIVLRDAQNREYWYDQGQSMFGVKDGMIKQLNPGTTISLSVVFNLPDQLTGLTLHYNGAVIPITDQNIVR